MSRLFHDLPESVDNTMEIFDKIDKLTWRRISCCPLSPLPKGFKDQDDYLRHLTYEGAKRRYGTIARISKGTPGLRAAGHQNSGYPVTSSSFRISPPLPGRWAYRRSGTGFGCGFSSGLLYRHHQRRPHQVRPAVRAFPQPGTGLHAGYRHRFR